MSLPPLKHPAWIMVAAIGLFGASVTTFLAGSYVASKVLIACAAFTAVMAGKFAKRF